MSMKSVMTHNFSQVPKIEIPRSVFNRSHGYKTTLDADYLVPFYVDEVLPGDTFTARCNMFGRLATPKFPFMDNLFLDTFFFAVPNRILWDNWEKFNGAQVDPGDSVDYLIPQIEYDDPGFAIGSLFDYMGLPTEVPNPISINALPLRAYNLIWNEWFRDQNLQDSIAVNRGDGPDAITDYPIQKRNKKHDYFTSCLPFPQKGDSAEISVLGGTYDALGNGKSIGFDAITDGSPDNQGMFWGSTDALDMNTAYYDQTISDTYINPATGVYPKPNRAIGLTQNAGKSGIEVTIPDQPVFTINALRESFQIQKLLEKNARGGTRYTEIIQTHFGVTSPDSRMQRPEYLGGFSERININPVSQTAVDANSPLGRLASYGTVAGSGHAFNKSFTEHCVIIGLVNIRADITYQRSLNRMWTRQTRYDFYWPSFAHLGEQAVLSKEIYYAGTSYDETVFGYQERYAEYRYKPSLITGLFRSDASSSLDAWHLSQELSLPSLNSAFIQSNTPLDRVIAVPSEPHLILDVFMELKCTRPMPVYSVPGLIDHF